jgi:hypothetical protein
MRPAKTRRRHEIAVQYLSIVNGGCECKWHLGGTFPRDSIWTKWMAKPPYLVYSARGGLTIPNRWRCAFQESELPGAGPACTLMGRGLPRPGFMRDLEQGSILLNDGEDPRRSGGTGETLIGTDIPSAAPRIGLPGGCHGHMMQFIVVRSVRCVAQARGTSIGPQ